MKSAFSAAGRWPIEAAHCAAQISDDILISGGVAKARCYGSFHATGIMTA